MGLTRKYSSPIYTLAETIESWEDNEDNQLLVEDLLNIAREVSDLEMTYDNLIKKIKKFKLEDFEAFKLGWIAGLEQQKIRGGKKEGMVTNVYNAFINHACYYYFEDEVSQEECDKIIETMRKKAKKDSG